MFTDLVKAQPIIYIEGASDRRLERPVSPKPAGRRNGRRGAPPPAGRMPPGVPGIGAYGMPAVALRPPVRHAAFVSPPRLPPRLPSPPRAITRERHLELYWDVTDKIVWTNVSDGKVAHAEVVTWWRSLSQVEKNSFQFGFPHYYSQVRELAAVKGMHMDNARHAASHIAMTGKFMYEQYMLDSMWTNTLINDRDYQQLATSIRDVCGVEIN